MSEEYNWRARPADVPGAESVDASAGYGTLENIVPHGDVVSDNVEIAEELPKRSKGPQLFMDLDLWWNWDDPSVREEYGRVVRNGIAKVRQLGLSTSILFKENPIAIREQAESALQEHFEAEFRYVFSAWTNCEVFVRGRYEESVAIDI
jgi:hypothetical protein